MTRQRSILVLLAALAFLSLTLFAPASQAAVPGPGDVLWSFVEDSPTHALDGFSCVAPGPNGSLYGAADYGFNYADGGDIVLVRFRASDAAVNHVIWKRTWDNPDFHKSDYPIAMAVDRSGNAIIAGQTDTTAGRKDGVVVKWLADGTQAWAATYANLVNVGDDWVTDVACDSHGNVYVSGSIGYGLTSQDWLVVKYRASDGKIMWREFYNGPKTSTGDDSAEAMVINKDGFIYVTGWSENLAHDRDLIVMKVTPRGTYRWIRRIDGAAHLEDRGRHIDLRSGNLYVTGETATASGRSALITKISTAGRRLWLHTWRPATDANLDVHDMAVDPQGNTVIAGWDDKGTPNPRAILVKWDAAGHRRWARQFWNTATGEQAYFTAVVVDGKGRIWAVGSIGDPPTSQDALLVRYSATGRRLWKSIIWGTDLRDDWFLGVTLCGTRSVFASGVMGSTAGNDDALAVKFLR